MKTTTLIKIAFLLLLIAFSSACVDDDPVTNNEIIKLVILNEQGEELDEAIGNGTDLITLRAELPDDVGEQFGTVSFKTTSGTFFGTTETSVQERVNAEGVAEVLLTLPLDSGDLFLTASIGSDTNAYSAQQTISLIGVDAVLNLHFKTLDGTTLITIPRADGTTLFNVESQVLADRENLNTVSFTATQGIFIETNNSSAMKSTNTEGTAQAGYKVPQQVGAVFFTATTGSNTQYRSEANLEFARAYADEIFVEPANLNMNTAMGNVINTFLVRDIGKVSLETRVDFEAFQLVDNTEIPVGRFTGLSLVKTDANGRAFATFFADTGDIDTNLPVTLRVSTLNDDGIIVSATIDIVVSE